jgi:hypothetical protein
MFRRSLPLALFFTVIAAVPSLAQTATRDTVGVAILTQALNASGVANRTNPIQDFVATGTITYFWAGEEVQGAATVRARGFDQFRLDASLPGGTRSWTVTRGAGTIKETDGSLVPVAGHNAVNLGVSTFPYFDILAALSDPLTVVSYVGLMGLNGRRVHQVRVQRRFPQEADPQGTASKLCTRDYFIDPLTGLLLKTLDMTHPPETLTEDLTHEIELGNYVPMQGVMVPTLVREKIIGQTIWELRLASVAFNAGLTDVDFLLQ